MPEHSNEFTLIYWMGFFCASFIRWRHSKQHPVELPRLEKSELPGMILAFLGMAVFPLLYTLTNLLSFANFDGHSTMGWIGAAGMAAAVWIIAKAHRELGRQWTHTPSQIKDPELVTSGIYARIRHPMYAAHFLWAISQALLLWNFVAGFGFLIAMGVFYPTRIKMEEASLRNTFGSKYEQYAKSTSRLWPW